MQEEEGELVQLHVYDLSRGLARQFSPMLLGKQIDGIWHSAVVVGGIEYYFGFGINVCAPGQSPFGQPSHVYDLGLTYIPEEIRDEFLVDLSERYTPQAYNLLHNNCNNFSNELAQLLVGHGIPEQITGLPAEVMSTPFGQMMLPMLQGLERQLGSVRQEAFVPHHPYPHAQPTTSAPQQLQLQAVEAAGATYSQIDNDKGISATAAPSAGPRAVSAVTTAAVDSASLAGISDTDAINTSDSSRIGGPAKDGKGKAEPEVHGVPAEDATAGQIAAATGLAMVKEAEEKLPSDDGCSLVNETRPTQVSSSSQKQPSGGDATEVTRSTDCGGVNEDEKTACEEVVREKFVRLAVEEVVADAARNVAMLQIQNSGVGEAKA